MAFLGIYGGSLWPLTDAIVFEEQILWNLIFFRYEYPQVRVYGCKTWVRVITIFELKFDRSVQIGHGYFEIQRDEIGNEVDLFDVLELMLSQSCTAFLERLWRLNDNRRYHCVIGLEIGVGLSVQLEHHLLCASPSLVHHSVNRQNIDRLAFFRRIEVLAIYE